MGVLEQMTGDIEREMAAGNWPKALELSRELAHKVPTSPKLHAYVGICCFRLQRFDEAVNSFRVALTLDDKYFDVALKLAQCLDRLMRYDEALTAAEIAVKLRPSDTTANVLINGLRRQVQHKHTGDGWVASKPWHNVTFADEDR
jgi:tetratricopeptide (TPR) repeat protein